MTIDLSQDVLRGTSPRLWVVRHGEYPAGTIEHGRYYTALDTSGDVVARCDTLRDAWEALCGDGRPRTASVAAPVAVERPQRARWIAGASLVCAPLLALGELLLLVSRP